MATKPGVQALTGVPLFAGLTTDELAALLRFSEVSAAKPGEAIVTEGKPSHRLCLILQGTCEVRRAGAGGKPLVVATLGERAVFGEIGLVAADSTATASVVATVPVQICAWQRDRFRTELDEGSSAAQKVLLNVAAVLAERLRSVLAEWTKLVDAGEKKPGGAGEFGKFRDRLLKEWSF